MLLKWAQILSLLTLTVDVRLSVLPTVRLHGNFDSKVSKKFIFDNNSSSK